jgi:hypothetical protein
MPGLSQTVEQMIDALREVAGDAVARQVQLRPDAAIERIVGSWPGAFSTPYANQLGFTADPDFASVIRQFIRDYLHR